MKSSNCFCSIIPPFVVNKLKEAGVITSKSVSMNQNFIKRRNLVLNNLLTQPRVLTLGAIIGPANRLIFDSQHTTNQRLHLVRNETGVAVADVSANKAYDNAGFVREYYKTKLNWQSIDNMGMNLIMNIHFDNEYNNAFWDGDEMTFGDGDGVIFTNFVNSLDVTAHELTHGVVQFTAGLKYKSQPGALNEHYADVFGSVIKQFALGQTAATADWLIGDTIMGPSLSGQAIRSMKAPGTAFNNQFMGQDPQPDHMNNFFTGTSDHFGVHINSGIPNKVFFLVSTDISTEKAGLLWFETLKTLKPTTSFKTFKTKLLSKARTLATSGKIPINSVAVANSAFASVGL
jgi:Zn-dependent metalloprotease